MTAETLATAAEAGGRRAQAGTGAFPYPDPPDPDKYSVCVHCGFCLEVCPTYQQTADENHSPRGRVYLIAQTAQGNLPLTAAVVDPVFSCLDCRACETVCPSGVQVGALVEEARGQVYAGNLPHASNSWMLRLLLRQLFPYPLRLHTIGWLLRLYQRSHLQQLLRNVGLWRLLPPHLRDMEAALPRHPGKPALTSLPAIWFPDGEVKATGALFTGCVMDVFFADINVATARVAKRNGIEVRVPRQQRCCGALHVHAGDREQARALARHNIDVFLQTGADYVMVNAAGCGAALREYPELFNEDAIYHERAQRFSARVRDISELLVEVGWRAPRGRIDQVVTYHDACHLCHAQHVRQQPRDLLSSIPGLRLLELADADRCCGSAGIYNLTHPHMAADLLERKLDDLPTGVSAVVMGNPGCLLQWSVGLRRRGMAVDSLHTVALLDLAYRREEESSDVADGSPATDA